MLSCVVLMPLWSVWVWVWAFVLMGNLWWWVCDRLLSAGGGLRYSPAILDLVVLV